MGITKRIRSPFSKVNLKRSKVQSSKKRKIEPFVSKFPPIDFDKFKTTPEVSVIVRAEQSRSDFNYLELKLSSDRTIKNIIDKIKEKHCSSTHNIKIYIIENSQKKYLNNHLFKTFQDLKVSHNEIFNVFYEYEPVENPLLTAGLA